MVKKFISFEGGEGTGKSTIIKAVSDYLDQKKVDYIVTREPGGVEISEAIRNIILDKKNTKMDARCEALLYAASRIQHLKEKVIPAINSNKIVICDRYVDSSLAYQGIARNIGINEVENINMFAMDYLPEKTILIDVSPEIALKRIKENNRETDRLDLESMEFHKKVYEGYLMVAEKYKNRIVKIDGNRCLEDIIKDCIKEIDKVIWD